MPFKPLTEKDVLLLAVAMMLVKLNEHNPETGYTFAVDHGLSQFLVMLIIAHACGRGALSVTYAMEAINSLDLD